MSNITTSSARNIYIYILYRCRGLKLHGNYKWSFCTYSWGSKSNMAFWMTSMTIDANPVGFTKPFLADNQWNKTEQSEKDSAKLVPVQAVQAQLVSRQHESNNEITLRHKGKFSSYVSVWEIRRSVQVNMISHNQKAQFNSTDKAKYMHVLLRGFAT